MQSIIISVTPKTMVSLLFFILLILLLIIIKLKLDIKELTEELEIRREAEGKGKVMRRNANGVLQWCYKPYEKPKAIEKK